MTTASTISTTQLQRRRRLQRDHFRALQQGLVPLLPVFDGLALRHRNQHRSSHWWSRFGVLRRTAKKLCGTPPSGLDSALARVLCLDHHVIPSCYVAFSQLAADTRHAPIGLALLGALATIKHAISPLASSSEAAPAGDGAAVAAASAVVPTERGGPDLGQVIHRDEIVSPLTEGNHNPPGSLPPPPPPKRKQGTKPRKTRGRADIAQLFDSIL